jgi:hypothetical protein
VIECKYCDATMTYHRSADAHAKGGSTAEGLHTGQLHCHYCLAVNPLPETCPVCGKKLTLFGLGTQRVEEELARKFPDLKFARVDSDSMRGAGDYEAVLSRFSRGEIQVMLGTQMIAKGLDYPNVTLVGVISADTALALPDFRSAERTFQLITQVAGRAGRGDSGGFEPGLRSVRRGRIETSQRGGAAAVCANGQDHPAASGSEGVAGTGRADGAANKRSGGFAEIGGSDSGPDAVRDRPNRGIFPATDRLEQPDGGADPAASGGGANLGGAGAGGSDRGGCGSGFAALIMPWIFCHG